MGKLLKAIAAVLLSTLILFAVLEIAFRFIGWPGASSYVEGIVDREQLTPRKAKDEVRVFAYGESTMHGSHYAPTSSPARWLEAYLKDFLPAKNIKVVNFARMGRGSQFTYETFRDTLVHKPDIAVFYLGHNEFFPGSLKDSRKDREKKFSYWMRDWMRHSYLLSTIYRWVIQAKMRRQNLEDRIEYEEIETMPPGIQEDLLTPPGTPLYQGNIDYFKFNIKRIMDLSTRQGVAVIFFEPVSNLKDFAPFYSLHQKELTLDELKQWNQFYEKGKSNQEKNRLSEALASYEKAYAIDSTYADLSFRMGQIYFEKGKLGKAKLLFTEARDNDALIVRAPSAIQNVFRELSKNDNLQLIETEEAVISKMPGGILGEPLIEDNVHFSLQGHALLGHIMAQEFAERGWIAPRDEWRFDHERPYQAMANEFGINDQLRISAYQKSVSYFGSRYDNRIRFAKKALELNPNSMRSLRYLAWSYWLKGDKEKAVEIYRKIGQINPHVLREIESRHPEIKTALTVNSSP